MVLVLASPWRHVAPEGTEACSPPCTPASRLRGHLTSQSWGFLFGGLTIIDQLQIIDHVFYVYVYKYIFIQFLFVKTFFRCGQAEVGARWLCCQQRKFQRNGAFPLKQLPPDRPSCHCSELVPSTQLLAGEFWSRDDGIGAAGSRGAYIDVHPFFSEAQSPSSHYCFGCVLFHKEDAFQLRLMLKATHSSTPKPSSCRPMVFKPSKNEDCCRLIL